jgi:hypothetical protein
MGLARRNALSTPHGKGGPLRTICKSTACATWTGPGGASPAPPLGCTLGAAPHALPCRRGLGSAAPPAPASCCCAAPTGSADGASASAAED